MKELLVERVGAIQILTLNRPHARNALSRGLIRALAEAIATGSADESVRCLVLAGAGEHFCAGADLRQNFADDPQLLEHIDEYMDEYHAVIRAMVHSRKPIVGELDGAAVGFGADLALACDLRVATERAYVQEKFVKIGLMPDGGGTFWLPRLVGTAQAMRLAMLAEPLNASEMARLGIAYRVVPPQQLREATLELAQVLDSSAPLALEEIRKAVYGSLGAIDEALRREREGQLRLLKSADAAEGIAAWLQRREPRFMGR